MRKEVQTPRAFPGLAQFTASNCPKSMCRKLPLILVGWKASFHEEAVYSWGLRNLQENFIVAKYYQLYVS